MPAAPASFLKPRYRPAQRFAVLLGDADGNRPLITDVVDDLLPEELHLGCGAQRLDSLFFKMDLSKVGRLQDTTTPKGFNRIVELRPLNMVTGKLDRCWGWGKLASQPQRIDGSNEEVRFTARLDHYLFGTPLRGYKALDPISATEVFIERDVVLNPEIDGTLFPNRSDETDANDARYVLDPESMRTFGARTLQAATATRWDLSSAIFLFCWLLNEDEEWITNPTLADLQAVCGTEEILLENLTFERGLVLPEVLDRLLDRFGFTWFVDHEVDTTVPDLPVTSTIKVIERGVGQAVVLRLQRIDQTIHNAQTNLHELDLTYDIASRPNVITGWSALALREGTFELRPAWIPTQDLLSIADLTPPDPEDVDVLRKLVLNEAGDWTDRRDDFDAETDLNPLFGVNTVPRRRRFLPALTRGKADKELIGVNGYLVEWRQSDNVWKPVPWSFSILENECGVLFEGELSEEFRREFLRRARSVAAGLVPPAMVRITCCIEADFRTSFTAERRDESPNGADHERDVNLGDKFGDRRVCDSGDFKSQFYDERHHAITGLVDGVGASQITIGTDLTEWLDEGDRLQIVGGTANDGTYHVDAVSWNSGTSALTIDVREAIPDDTTVAGTLCVLTDEEQPDTKLEAFVTTIQEREDFVIIKASPVVLHGIDRFEYARGQVVPSIQPRNLSLNSLADAAAVQRHPQILGFRLDFAKQLTIVELEQSLG